MWPKFKTSDTHPNETQQSTRYAFLSTDQWVKEHVVILDVLFADDSVEVWQTKPAVTKADLAANIGGSMGLYLGISVIGVTEVLVLLVSLCRVTAARALVKVHKLVMRAHR